MKNKISNLSYFTKRVKDNGFVAWKIFNNYSEMDSRLWTVLLNPGAESIYITCRKIMDEGKNSLPEFEINHDFMKLHKNLKIRTLSMEVVISALIKSGARCDSELYREQV
jgi:hypothetical protein